MQLHKISISKTKLKSIPEDEQIFFVQITNFLKGSKFSIFFFLSILAGKLWEVWKLLQKNSKLLRTYEPLLDLVGKEGLKNLRKYFGKDNLINHVRNKFAFHYDSAP